jgi:predicted metallopeptidase
MCKDSGYTCPALDKLLQIYKETRHKEQHQLIKKLQKDIGIVDAEPSKDLRKLAESIFSNASILSKFPELQIIREYDIKVGYVVSQENPGGTKIKYADCRKLKWTYKAYLPYDFIITFYARNIELLSENQRKIVMLHELLHIGSGEKGLKLVEHDTEDFAKVLESYGIRWNNFEAEVLDILEIDIIKGEDNG